MHKVILVTLLVLLKGCSTTEGGKAPDRVLVANEGGMVPIRYAIPDYPEEARQQKIEGWVLVEFTVTEDGRPENISVVESEPDDVFDQSALEAAAQLVYVPRVQDGRLVAVSGVQYRYMYDLADAADGRSDDPESVR